MKNIKILAPGLLTSVQDEGRFGRQRYGMSPAGAMDLHSMILANLLVGNPRNTGVLECTFMGPTIEFESDAVVAVTGADMSPQVNGAAVPMGQAFRILAGSTLKLSNVKNGCRSYIAIAGGLDIPRLNGSQSTLLRTGVGGYHGRKLAAGDVIPLKVPALSPGNLAARCLDQPQNFEKEVLVRVTLGPQDDRFTKAGIETFLSQTYTVSPKSDRMASRLEGPKVEHTTDANIISDGIPLGAVQIPGSGEPIIMMSEHQGSGGYTKIANVISVDIPLIAQCGPGSKIPFQAIGVEQAQELYLAQEEEYRQLEEKFKRVHRNTYQISVDGQPYTVLVERQ